jgi:hypothetical protein
MGRTVNTRTEKRAASRRNRDARQASQKVSSRRVPPVLSRGEIGMNTAAIDNRPIPRRRVDVPLSKPGAEIRLPAVPQVSNKWRILSGVIAISTLMGLILLTQSALFQVKKVDIQGLERFTRSEISRAIQVTGSSIFFINPERIKQDLQLTYPGLSEVEVKVSWPANISISLEERYPVLAWSWDGHVRWVDSQGIAFEPHDEGLDVVQVNSAMLPPTVENRFVDPRIVDMVSALAPYLPEGEQMIFDPEHGLGWQDPRGWVVYFGFNDDDADQKMTVYLSLVDYLEGKRITPELINVEFLDSPYFRMEQ